MTDYRAEAVNALNGSSDPGTRGVIAALLHVAFLLEGTVGPAQPSESVVLQGRVWRTAAVNRLRYQAGNHHTSWLNTKAVSAWLTEQNIEVSEAEVPVGLWKLCEAGVLRSNGSDTPAFAVAKKGWLEAGPRTRPVAVLVASAPSKPVGVGHPERSAAVQGGYGPYRTPRERLDSVRPSSRSPFGQWPMLFAWAAGGECRRGHGRRAAVAGMRGMETSAYRWVGFWPHAEQALCRQIGLRSVRPG